MNGHESGARPAAREAAEMLGDSRRLPSSPSEPERLGRFLALTGIGPPEFATAAREPGFLAGVLDHLAADEVAAARVSPRAGGGRSGRPCCGRVRRWLGPAWEREVP